MVNEPDSPHVIALLKQLQPGDFFVRHNDKTVFRCEKVVDNAVRCHEMEGPKGRRTARMFRTINVSTIERILKGSEV